MYFTSEEEAREGEQKPPPPELEQMMKEMDTLTVGETTLLRPQGPLDARPGLSPSCSPGDSGGYACVNGSCTKIPA